MTSWRELMSDVINARECLSLRGFLEARRREASVYPPEPDVFRAFKECPFKSTRVVIVGQDPYHGPGQANGLAFGVNKGMPRPPSLRNILKELSADLRVEISPVPSTLLGWAKQGVLLLNTSLTVDHAEPGSHSAYWEFYTNAVIKRISDVKHPGSVVFLLWGNHAKGKRKFISRMHAVEEAAHPSPLSVRGFWGCKHFSKANAHLQNAGLNPINWLDIDGDANV